ncbi:MAG: hypothetical protein NVV72_12515 [Asticcacaulis sp.]|nr:hypothetical protein [Asticcacaulis sp.]
MDMLKAWLKPLSKRLYPAGLAVFLILCGLLFCLGGALLLRKGVFSADLFLPTLLIASGVQIFSPPTLRVSSFHCIFYTHLDCCDS